MWHISLATSFAKSALAMSVAKLLVHKNARRIERFAVFW
jgi:hypothetical protein